MNKSILIIDTPEKCGNCRLCYKDNFDDDSWFTYRCTESNDKVDYENIYENCPLRPLPKRKFEMRILKKDHYEESKYIKGYNDCLNEILGEGEEK